MIPFFRKIRNPPAGEAGKMADDNKPMKYMRYAVGEIALVVIGILIALQINNLNELKKEQEITNKYLSGFRIDLEKDRMQLDKLITIREKQSSSAKALLHMLELNELDIDSFYHHYYFLFPFYRFIPNSNTLEEVLNSSHLRFITDEEIKNKILDLRSSYKGIQLNEEHVYEDRSVYLYSALTLNNIEFNGLFVAQNAESFSSSKDAKVYRNDAEYFMKDRHFKSFLNLLEYNLQYVIPKVYKVRDECNSIISLIDEKK